jgi:hypothetical protein
LLGFLVTAPPAHLRVFAGLFGSADPTRNIRMTLFWVMFLLGFAYLTLIAGYLYALINPWRAMINGLERLGCNLNKRSSVWILSLPLGAE